MISLLSQQIAGLSGWRRAGVAFMAGALSCLALPPFHLVPILFVSFGTLVWLMDGACNAVRDGGGLAVNLPLRRRVRNVFAVGWSFGFGQLLFGLYWISNALLVDGATFAWAVPLSAAALPAGLAIFPALGLVSAAVIWNQGAGRVLVLAIFWTGAEWVRGHAFTGFPWNLMGYVWADTGAMLQGVALVGIYGLGLITVLLAAAPAVLANSEHRPGLAWTVIGVGLVSVTALWIWGAVRLTGADALSDLHPDVVLRIVQPNIEQRLKWHRSQRRANFERHLDLTSAPGADAITHVIWPEAATPYYLDQDSDRRAEIASRLKPNQVLLAGTLRSDHDASGALRFWNSFVAFDDLGRIQTTYDKSHLVPFGEYLPLRRFLAPFGIEKVTAGFGDYSAGPGRKTLQVSGAPPFSPLICYEVVFPGEVAGDQPRPAWLLNVTNDAWYGFSTGPYQHLAMARVRAVEEGLPLVRAANTGISSIIDPYGRTVAEMGLGEGGVLDAPLPLALENMPLYARFGDWLWAPILLIFAAGARIIRE